jgi:hypothetical protein
MHREVIIIIIIIIYFFIFFIPVLRSRDGKNIKERIMIKEGKI